MEQAAEDYFARQKLADFTIASTLGLSTADREIIEEMPGVTSVEAEQIADINAENHRAVKPFFLELLESVSPFHSQGPQLVHHKAAIWASSQ